VHHAAIFAERDAALGDLEDALGCTFQVGGEVDEGLAVDDHSGMPPGTGNPGRKCEASQGVDLDRFFRCREMRQSCKAASRARLVRDRSIWIGPALFEPDRTEEGGLTARHDTL